MRLTTRQGVPYYLGLNINNKYKYKYVLVGIVSCVVFIYVTFSNKESFSQVTGYYWGEGQNEYHKNQKVIDLPPELEEWKNINASLWREESGRAYADDGTARMKLLFKWVEDLSQSEFFKRSKVN